MKVKIAVVALIGLASAGLYNTMLHAQEARSVWDGVYTKEQADAGKSLYAQDCGSCHGDQLTGGEMAPPLAGGDFLSNWNGLTVGDFFDRVRSSMPLNKPGSLSREVNRDITAFILSANSFPAGTTALDTKSEVLKTIRIDAAKPK
jgi:S-disulfanyl-L-cysteine oxidoreductase SoxD